MRGFVTLYRSPSQTSDNEFDSFISNVEKLLLINLTTLFFFIRTSKFCLRLAVLNCFSFLRLKCS